MQNYNTDKPVKQKEQDLFNRYKFAESIANSIKNNKNSDSVVYGISGAWGEGKTSLLNFIESELTTSYPNVLTIKFNPWRYKDESVLLQSLFNSIARTIKNSTKQNNDKKNLVWKPKFLQKHEEPLQTDAETLGELLLEYAEIASYVKLGKLFNTIGKKLSNTNLSDKKERIEKILEKIQKRIVIFVDDIDRLDKNEIYSIFRIVKLTGNFKYMTYILSFDEDMVASSIGERFSNEDSKAGYRFLEKIIQVPLNVPKAQNSALRKVCFNLVNQAVNKGNISLSEQDNRRFIQNFNSYIFSRLKTPRLAIRYSNSLQYSLPLLKGEVNYVDLMLLEAIKIFYPEVYVFIKTNRNLFTSEYVNSYRLQKDDSKIKKAKIQIDELLNNSNNSEDILPLLKSLFPQLNEIYSNTILHHNVHNEWYLQKRICSPKYFDRYFTFSISEGEIPDIIFDNLMRTIKDKTDKELSEQFNELIQSYDMDEFLFKVQSNAKVLSTVEARKVSKALVLIGSQFSAYSKDVFYGLDSPMLQVTLFLKNLIKDIDPEKEKFKIAEELLTESESFAFAYELNLWLTQGNDERKIFSNEECQALSIIILDRAKHESGEKPIFEAFDRYVKFIFNTWNTLNKTEFSSYIDSIIQNDKTKVRSLIKACIPTTISSNYPIPYKSDLTKDTFDWIKTILNVDYIYQTILEVSTDKIDISDVKFTPREPNSSIENIIKQFIFWYKEEA